jgi:hypothetical protein
MSFGKYVCNEYQLSFVNLIPKQLDTIRLIAIEMVTM